MPIWVINVASPIAIGKWTTVLMKKIMVVRLVIEWTIWSVAHVQDPIFRCRSLSINNTGWKNGMFGIHAIVVEGEMILPVKLLMKWEELEPPDWNWALEFTVEDS